jgi:hypothetical protein
MRTLFAAVFGSAVLGNIGCMSSAKIVQSSPNGGVIEVKAGIDPNQAMIEAQKCVERELGKDYTIEIITPPPVPGMVGNPKPSGNGQFNPNNSMTPGQVAAAPPQPTMFKFTKRNGSTPAGLPPAPMVDTAIQQTGYQQPQRQPMNNAPVAGFNNGTQVGQPMTAPPMPFGNK